MPKNIRELAGLHHGLEYCPFSEVILHPHRLIGIEIEVEGARHSPSGSRVLGWDQHEEFSLRNHGREFVSQPMMGDDIVMMVGRLYEALTDLNPEVEFTKRCSIHIHVDCRRRTLEDLLGTTRNYVFFEELLFKYVGNNRVNNIYCVPIASSDSLLLNAARVLGSDKGFHFLPDSWSKYSAYNILPLNHYGTIEWRHHPGSLIVEDVIDWVNIVLCVMESGNIDVVREFQEHGIGHVLDKVFGSMASTLTPYLNDDVILKGLKSARNFDLLFSLNRGSRGVLKCRHQRSALHKLRNGEL